MSATFSASVETAITGLIADRARQRLLCDWLEQVADGLPTLPGRPAIEALCAALAAIGHAGIGDEVRLLARFSNEAGDRAIAAALDGLTEHWHALDAMHAADLAEALLLAAAEPSAPRPTELAYMLRCCFDGLRRASAFEALALLAVGGDRLSARSRGALLASVTAA